MDHLSSTILMCAILVLFYASGTVKGTALGDGCTLPSSGTPDPCTTTDTNTECIDRVTSGTFKCECKSGFYKSGTACNARKNPDAACEANQCVENAVCNSADSECDCNTNYRATPTTNPTSCERLALDAVCTSPSSGSPDPCTDTNTECSDRVTSGTFKCECTSGFYKSGTACIARKKPGMSCTGDQCVANSACTNSECTCSTGYIATPTGNSPTSCTRVVAFDGDCTNDACTEDKTECSSNKCVCTGTSYRDTANSACVDRKNPAADCTGDQCVANAACSSTKCVCKTDYIATPTINPTSCKSSDAATIMLAHMHVFIFGTVASLYFLV